LPKTPPRKPFTDFVVDELLRSCGILGSAERPHAPYVGVAVHLIPRSVEKDRQPLLLVGGSGKSVLVSARRLRLTRVRQLLHRLQWQVQWRLLVVVWQCEFACAVHERRRLSIQLLQMSLLLLLQHGSLHTERMEGNMRVMLLLLLLLLHLRLLLLHHGWLWQGEWREWLCGRCRRVLRSVRALLRLQLLLLLLLGVVGCLLALVARFLNRSYSAHMRTRQRAMRMSQ